MYILRSYLFIIICFIHTPIVYGQTFSIKGQLWGSGIIGDDPAEDQSSYEAQLGYIPTISIYQNFDNSQLLDIEWAYRINRMHGGNVLLATSAKPYRGWLRYSSPKVEARLGLQKIAFGPAQFLRPTSWFDTIDLRDPTGQTDGVESFRLRFFPINNVSIWSWAINSKTDTLSYGGRAELSLDSGDWGFTYHQDPTVMPQKIGLFPIMMSGPHDRFALDYRYDGFIGFWFEGSALISENKNYSGFSRYSMISAGGDFTVPIGNGVLLMTETMNIKGSSLLHSRTDNHSYSVFMASFPVGLLHQLMAISQIDWRNKQRFYYFRWGITFDYFSVNILFSANPKRVDYDLPTSYLPTSLSGFGQTLNLMLIYNH